MPLAWTISHEEQLVSARAEGTIRYQDVAAFLEAAQTEGVHSYRKLIDAREAVGEFSESDLNSYAGAFSGYTSIGPLGPIALVVGPLDGPPPLALLRRLTSRPRPLTRLRGLGDFEDAHSL